MLYRASIGQERHLNFSFLFHSAKYHIFFLELSPTAQYALMVPNIPMFQQCPILLCYNAQMFKSETKSSVVLNSIWIP